MYNTNSSINKHEYAQLVELKKLTEIAYEKDIAMSVFGGYGFDGLAGWITQRHHNFEVLVKNENREAFKKLLDELGYVLEKEDENKEYFICEKLEDFRIELVKKERLEEFLEVGETELFPDVINAKLYDFKFYTPSVKGHEFINEIQEKKKQSKNKEVKSTHEESKKLFVKYLKKQNIFALKKASKAF